MPQSSNPQHSEILDSRPVPARLIVDFEKLPSCESEILKLKDACRETGFIILRNALGKSNSIDRTWIQMQQFFSLDEQDPIKQAASVQISANKYGWTPMFGEPAYQPETIAHLESFDCGRNNNVWPDIADFKRDIRDCWNTMSAIGDVVLQSFAMSVGVHRDFFRRKCATRELNTMRLLHYPANDAPVADKNVGIAAHTDFECITLILQTASGLELRANSGKWHDAPSDQGQIVVLTGDMLEHWTNGYFRATSHRVRNTHDQRMSIVLFIAVNEDETVTPLPEFVSEQRPSRYAPIKQREHLDEEVRRAERNRDEMADDLDRPRSS